MFLHHAIAVNFDFMLIAITTLSTCLEHFKQEWQMLVQFSHSVGSDSLWPHGLQHTKLSCPSPAPRACSNLRPSSQWCHATISSSVIPFSCLQSFPASACFPMSQFFTSGYYLKCRVILQIKTGLSCGTNYSWALSTFLPLLFQFSSVQSLSHIQLFATPWTAAHQASLSITNT